MSLVTVTITAQPIDGSPARDVTLNPTNLNGIGFDTQISVADGLRWALGFRGFSPYAAYRVELEDETLPKVRFERVYSVNEQGLTNTYAVLTADLVDHSVSRNVKVQSIVKVEELPS